MPPVSSTVHCGTALSARTFVAEIDSVGSSRDDAFNHVTDVATVEHIGNIGQRYHYETSRVSRQGGFDALLYGKIRQRILSIDPEGVAHRDTSLVDAPQTFLDQSPVATVVGLISADKQRGRSLWIKGRRSSASACSAQYCRAPSMALRSVVAYRRRFTPWQHLSNRAGMVKVLDRVELERLASLR
jgi:hypothetical protein